MDAEGRAIAGERSSSAPRCFLGHSRNLISKESNAQFVLNEKDSFDSAVLSGAGFL